MTNTSGVRTHHDTDEIREAIALDRLRLLARHSRRYSVSCDCWRHTERFHSADDCEGLTVFNPSGEPVARYTGRQYVAATTLDGGIAVFSRLVRN